MTTYHVAIPLRVSVNEGQARILTRDAPTPEAAQTALTIGFEIDAPTPEDAALILYERLESICGDP